VYKQKFNQTLAKIEIEIEHKTILLTRNATDTAAYFNSFGLKPIQLFEHDLFSIKASWFVAITIKEASCNVYLAKIQVLI
jgi:hypothetical protein